MFAARAVLWPGAGSYPSLLLAACAYRHACTHVHRCAWAYAPRHRWNAIDDDSKERQVYAQAAYVVSDADIERHRADMERHRADIERHRADMERHRADIERALWPGLGSGSVGHNAAPYF